MKARAWTSLRGLFECRSATAVLGLIGMRERVHALGGTLSLESGPGAGTTVKVTLPVNRREAEEAS